MSRLELELGERKLHIHAYPSAHSDNDLSIYDEQTQTLWLSDLLFMEHTPVIHASLNGWLSVLDDLIQTARPTSNTRTWPSHCTLAGSSPGFSSLSQRAAGRNPRLDRPGRRSERGPSAYRLWRTRTLALI